MADQDLKNIALLIDADNTTPKGIDPVLTVMAELGQVNIKRAGTTDTEDFLPVVGVACILCITDLTDVHLNAVIGQLEDRLYSEYVALYIQIQGAADALDPIGSLQCHRASDQRHFGAQSGSGSGDGEALLPA